MKIVLLIALISCVVGVLVTHLRLIGIERATPELLLSVGIRRIDWWWGCVRGIYRLAFLAVGSELPRSTRVAFKFALATYPLVIVAMLVDYMGLL